MMRPPRRRRRGAALLVALSLTAVACGRAADDTADQAGRPVDQSAPSDTAATGSSGLSGDLDGQIEQVTAMWPTDWENRTVGLDEFRLGIGRNDPRDVIAPIDAPNFEPVANATWLDPREPGALVQFEGDVRFYPLSILTRHEIVNDEFGEVPVVVTFCPLCNAAVSFDRRVDGQVLRFGVSGLLRHSDLVMWDDATTSLWQQISGEAVVGDFAGTELDPIPTSIVAYGDVLENFPDARSLSTDTGFSIEYGANPYQAYSSSTIPFLFDGELDDRFAPLSRVVGVTVDDDEKAYPFSAVTTERAINDEVGGIPIAVFWGGETVDALDATVIAESEVIGSGIAYDRRVADQLLTFAPSDGTGDVGGNTFTDAETGSTWTLLGRAIAGPLEGQQLQTVTHRNEFWFAWAAFFPHAPVHPDVDPE